MNIATTDSQSAPFSIISDLATWNRERSSEELQDFINSHHAALANSDEIE